MLIPLVTIPLHKPLDLETPAFPRLPTLSRPTRLLTRYRLYRLCGWSAVAAAWQATVGIQNHTLVWSVRFLAVVSPFLLALYVSGEGQLALSVGSLYVAAVGVIVADRSDS